MEWDNPSPTITTQFFGFGNGSRFGFLRAEHSAQSAGNGTESFCRTNSADASPCVV